MSFLFATSHLPETRARRPDEWEDEDEDAQPMQHSGGVRAFSHLPQRAHARKDFEGPLFTRPAIPVGRRPYIEPEHDHAKCLA